MLPHTTISGHRLTALRFVFLLVTDAVSDFFKPIAVVQHATGDVIIFHTRGVRVKAGEPALLAALLVWAVLTGARAAVTPVVV